MLFSICIPTYEAHGRGAEFLGELLESIYQQTFKDFEIVISDHSLSDIIFNEFQKWKDKLPIKYLLHDNGRGNSSINMNYAIVNSVGKYIKIMHMDDKFCDNMALEKLSNSLKNEAIMWGGMGFNHFYEKENEVRRPMIPDINDAFGCPSVSFFINDKENPNLYNGHLIMINDFEMHNRLLKRYGSPHVIPDICVTIRMHEKQVSETHREQEKAEFHYYEKHIKPNV